MAGNTTRQSSWEVVVALGKRRRLRSRGPFTLQRLDCHRRLCTVVENQSVSGHFRLGAGGWTYEPWRGTFYPEELAHKREFGYASRKLTSIEINGYVLRFAKARKLWHVA
jgi:hypothetical protein